MARSSDILGDARHLDFPDDAFDVVLLMGPLYHLPDPADRLQALQEAHRVLRPGGLLISEVISRHAWILDATAKGIIDDPDVRREFDTNITTGLSSDPETLRDGGFWAYFHHVHEVVPEHQRGGSMTSDSSAWRATPGCSRTSNNFWRSRRRSSKSYDSSSRNRPSSA